MIITSLENEKVKKLRKLQQKKYREEYNQYIVEGLHLVLEAYKTGMLLEVILVDGEECNLPVPFTYVTEEVMKKISTMDTYSTIIGVVKKNNKNEVIGNRILILDGIQDPGNLGTIIRSAVAFNIDTIVLSENTVDLYNPKVLRATQGMLYYTNIVNINAVDVIMLLHNMGINVYGTDVVDGVDVRDLTKEEKEKFALVMGNEGNGVRSIVKDMCDKNLYINMNKNVESLNVGIATSILLYELGR